MSMKIQNKYQGAVKTAVKAGIALGPAGLMAGPADAIAIGAIWTTLFVSMAKSANKELDSQTIKAVALAAAKGTASYAMGCKVASYLVALIPVLGTPGAIGISSLANAVFTYRFALMIQNILASDRLSQDLMFAISQKFMPQFPSFKEIQGVISDMKDWALSS